MPRIRKDSIPKQVKIIQQGLNRSYRFFSSYSSILGEFKVGDKVLHRNVSPTLGFGIVVGFSLEYEYKVFVWYPKDKTTNTFGQEGVRFNHRTFLVRLLQKETTHAKS